MEYPTPAIKREPTIKSKLKDTNANLPSIDTDKEEEEAKVSTSKKIVSDGVRLRHVFRRPFHADHKHPIFSSPYAKQISIRAFGRKKPRWFKTLDNTQLFLFKNILNQVEIARQGWFSLDNFIDTFKDFDSTITRSEIVDIIDSIEKDEFDELDFGQFLFLLAYRDKAEPTQSENMEEDLSAKVATPRQSLILSAIANYILISNVKDIEKFYMQNTIGMSTVLHYHLEENRLYGLSEAEMEIKQIKAARNLKPIFDRTGSPYALPVPFVPRFAKCKIYEEWKKSKYSLPIIDHHSTIIKPSLPPNLRKEILPEIQRTVTQMHYGRLPLPVLKFPEDKLKEMRSSCTVEVKDYLMERAHQAKNDMRDNLKKAAVIYAKSALVDILLVGFPSEKAKNKFVRVYQKYLPLNERDVKDFSLWLNKPSGHEVKQDIRKVYPEKYAFGTKIR